MRAIEYAKNPEAEEMLRYLNMLPHKLFSSVWKNKKQVKQAVAAMPEEKEKQKRGKTASRGLCAEHYARAPTVLSAKRRSRRQDFWDRGQPDQCWCRHPRNPLCPNGMRPT